MIVKQASGQKRANRQYAFAAPKQARLFVQFVEQRLGVLQVGGVEAFREPAADFGEHRACFVASAWLRQAV